MKLHKYNDWVEYPVTRFAVEGAPDFNETLAIEVDEKLFYEYKLALVVLAQAERIVDARRHALFNEIHRAETKAEWEETLKNKPSRATKTSFLLTHGWVETGVSLFRKNGVTLKMHLAVEQELQSVSPTKD